MVITVITPPPAVVSLVEAKAHLRVEHDDDDTLITSQIAAAQQVLDGPAGWLQRAIGSQVLELTAETFDGDAYGSIVLPFPPVQAIVSVTAVDTYGVSQTVDAGQYVLAPPATVRPIYGVVWPLLRAQPDAVRIRYRAGYDDDAVPAPIKAAILLMTADLYQGRDGKVEAAMTINPTIERLLATYRVWS